MFTVVGSTSDNTLTIYVASSSNNKVFRLTTIDVGNSFTSKFLQSRFSFKLKFEKEIFMAKNELNIYFSNIFPTLKVIVN